MYCDIVVSIEEASQVGEARRVAGNLCDGLGFDETERGKAAIVASELANNVLRHGGGGQILMRLVSGRSAFQIIAIDRGPGMSDVSRCLQDGFTTGGTMGSGLGAVRRLSTAFDIFSAPGHGTVVLSRVGPSSTATNSEQGVTCVAARGERECGDTWRYASRDGTHALMLADGLGHGPLAASAAERAAEVFSANPFDSPASILQNMHQSLKSTRGVAVAVALVNQTSGKVNYAGIGNIAAVLISSSRSRQGMISHHGTLGVQINSIRELEYTLPDRGLLIMHSDGLQSRWTLDGLPGLASRYADVIAATLYRDFGRGRDDASVMVLRLGVDHD